MAVFALSAAASLNLPPSYARVEHKSAPPNLKFSANLSLTDEIYKVKPRIIFDTVRFRSLDL